MEGVDDGLVTGAKRIFSFHAFVGETVKEGLPTSFAEVTFDATDHVLKIVRKNETQEEGTSYLLFCCMEVRMTGGRNRELLIPFGGRPIKSHWSLMVIVLWWRNDGQAKVEELYRALEISANHKKAITDKKRAVKERASTERAIRALRAERTERNRRIFALRKEAAEQRAEDLRMTST